MFEQYMDHPNNESDILEEIYGKMLSQIGNYIQECVNRKHFGDDTYFDYIPTAISFATAYYDTLANDNMEFHIHTGVADQATEVLGELVWEALVKLNEVDALGGIHTIREYFEEDTEHYRQLGLVHKYVIEDDPHGWIIEARPKK